jgi:hypothetical protein
VGEPHNQHATCQRPACLALEPQPTAQTGGDARDAGAREIACLADREEQGLSSVVALLQVHGSLFRRGLPHRISQLTHSPSRSHFVHAGSLFRRAQA